jgi:uncharacterized protein (TIGR02597 family)
MKITKILLTGFAATAALLSNINAQSTVAVTDPVGYVTVNVAGGNNAETFIGASLYNAVDFNGAVTARAANSISVAAGSFTAGQFDGKYFVEIASGTNAGFWTDIVATPNATTITTSDDLTSLLAVGDSIKIRKHHTIESFFGDSATAGDQNRTGLLAGAQISDADNIVIFNPESQSPTVLFYSTDEFDGGWRTASGTSVSDMIIAPGQGIKVIRKSSGAATAISFTQVGHVKTGPTNIVIEPGENFVSVPLATGVSLLNTTLGNAGKITPGPQISLADNVVLNTGDNLFKSVYFSTDEFDGGWRDAGAIDFANYQLAEGKSFNIINNVPSTAAFNLTFPAQTINP